MHDHEKRSHFPLEKTKQRLQSEMEDLMVDVGRPTSVAANLDKKL